MEEDRGQGTKGDKKGQEIGDRWLIVIGCVRGSYRANQSEI